MELIDLTILLINYKYLGAFLLNFIASSSVLFPIPFYLAHIYLATILSPIPLSIISALGSCLGEFTGYLTGYWGGDVLKLKKNRFYKLAKTWFKRYGGWAVFVFAATPLPDDVVGIVAGAVKYKKSKFLLFSFLGKLVMFLAISFAVQYSYAGIAHFFHLG